MLRQPVASRLRGWARAAIRSVPTLLTCLLVFGIERSADADIIVSGNVAPGDPVAWNQGTTSYIGYSSAGALSITNGSRIDNRNGYVGYLSGATGKVAVQGAGSTLYSASWLQIGYRGRGELSVSGGGMVSNTGAKLGGEQGSMGIVMVDGEDSSWRLRQYPLEVGNLGQGRLEILSGAQVHVSTQTWIGRQPGGSGVIHFEGGTLNTGTLFCGLDDLTGKGTINTEGIVSDLDLVFDATHGWNQTLRIQNNPDQDITVNLNAIGNGWKGVGYRGVGTMRVAEGRIVPASYGWVGVQEGSVGEVTVEGTGSWWQNSGGIYIGYRGTGVLSVSDGATLTGDGNIGMFAGSSGEVTIDGPGSTWSMASFCTTGWEGQGKLDILNGGSVRSNLGRIGSKAGSIGEVTVDGPGSTWTIYREGHTTDNHLYVGDYGNGILNITNRGLVSVRNTLTIDLDGDGNSFINMASGGMLALYGKGDGSLAGFLDLIEGTDAIRYWDDTAMVWADITTATYGEDYFLNFISEGDLAGYTMLTVPEPATLVLLSGLCLIGRRRPA